MSDASGNAYWSASASGTTATGITGGTANYITKFGTGGNGLYASQIYDNGTNVGIGTNTPSQQLEITGNFKLPSTTSTGTPWISCGMSSTGKMLDTTPLLP